MYSTMGNVSYISGDFGRYDSKKVKNHAVRYGRNTINSYYQYLANYVQPNVELKIPKYPKRIKNKDIFSRISQFIQDLIYDFKMKKTQKQTKKMEEYESRRTPLKFVMQYIPNGSSQKEKLQALLGTAYEEMGRKTSVPVEQMEKTIQIGDDFVAKSSAEALDINKDGKISTGEYATSILVADAFSESDKFSSKNINGIINQDGMNMALAHTTEKNRKMASKVYSILYKHFGLEQAEKEFLSNKNNLRGCGKIQK